LSRPFPIVRCFCLTLAPSALLFVRVCRLPFCPSSSTRDPLHEQWLVGLGLVLGVLVVSLPPSCPSPVPRHRLGVGVVSLPPSRPSPVPRHWLPAPAIHPTSSCSQGWGGCWVSVWSSPSHRSFFIFHCRCGRPLLVVISVPPAIHPTSSCLWAWGRVVCRSCILVVPLPGCLPPTPRVHPASSRSRQQGVLVVVVVSIRAPVHRASFLVPLSFVGCSTRYPPPASSGSQGWGRCCVVRRCPRCVPSPVCHPFYPPCEQGLAAVA
jgi:hypothetical protein